MTGNRSDAMEHLHLMMTPDMYFFIIYTILSLWLQIWATQYSITECTNSCNHHEPPTIYAAALSRVKPRTKHITKLSIVILNIIVYLHHYKPLWIVFVLMDNPDYMISCIITGNGSLVLIDRNVVKVVIKWLWVITSW